MFLGLGIAIDYTREWWLVWQHGPVLLVFKWQFERWGEPYILAALLVVLLSSAVKQLLELRER